MHVLSRLRNYLVESYVVYVLSKEDIHELAYQQAHKGGLKRSTFILLGSLFRLSYIVVFVYMTYTNYVNLRYNHAFLSLSSHAGECSVVPKDYTFPNLNADTNGYWESERNYTPAISAYKFSLYHLIQTMQEYEAFMGEMRDAVAGMGADGLTHNLAINLLYWCFWEHDMSKDGLTRRVKFSGKPEHILNLDQVYGTISDVKHDSCSVGLSSGYDFSKSDMFIDFDISNFENNFCAGILVRLRLESIFILLCGQLISNSPIYHIIPMI